MASSRYRSRRSTRTCLLVVIRTDVFDAAPGRAIVGHLDEGAGGPGFWRPRSHSGGSCAASHGTPGTTDRIPEPASAALDSLCHHSPPPNDAVPVTLTRQDIGDGLLVNLNDDGRTRVGRSRRPLSPSTLISGLLRGVGGPVR